MADIPPKRPNGLDNIAFKVAKEARPMVCLACASGYGYLVVNHLGEVERYRPEPMAPPLPLMERLRRWWYGGGARDRWKQRR